MGMKPIVSLVIEVEVAIEVAAATKVVAMAGETTKETVLMDHR